RGELFATLRPHGNGARSCCTRQELLFWQCRRAELRVLRPVSDAWCTSPTSEVADRRHGSSRVKLEIFTTCSTLALAVREGQSTGRGGAQRRCAYCSHASAV